MATRSVLPDWLTALWNERKGQRLKSRAFRYSSASPSLALIVSGPTEGRNTYPFFSALAIDRWARLKESGRQTTRVTRLSVVSADSSERAVGTAPPAHGSTEQSGAG